MIQFRQGPESLKDGMIIMSNCKRKIQKLKYMPHFLEKGDGTSPRKKLRKSGTTKSVKI